MAGETPAAAAASRIVGLIVSSLDLSLVFSGKVRLPGKKAGMNLDISRKADRDA